METVLEAGECENLMTGEWDGGGDVGERGRGGLDTIAVP